MVSNDKRIRIITGHYGSGKTEFAVNYVTALREQTEGKVAIADLDIVNVYFRSREKKAELEEKGIMVIASNIEGAGADVPAVSGAMTMPVTNKEFQYVVDLGGNDVGTLVLGRMKPLLHPEETDFFMVVNTYRPNTSTPEGVIEQMENLEYASGLKDVYKRQTIPNKEVAFKPQRLDNTLGEYISSLGLKQLRTAETEKYAHVTFFFNGGVEEPNPNEDVYKRQAVY